MALNQKNDCQFEPGPVAPKSGNPTTLFRIPDNICIPSLLRVRHEGSDSSDTYRVYVRYGDKTIREVTSKNAMEVLNAGDEITLDNVGPGFVTASIETDSTAPQNVVRAYATYNPIPPVA